MNYYLESSCNYWVSVIGHSDIILYVYLNVHNYYYNIGLNLVGFVVWLLLVCPKRNPDQG